MVLIFTDEPEAASVIARTKESEVGIPISLTTAEQRMRERSRAWFLANKEKQYAINKPYSAKYSKTEKAKATRAAWREKNREKLREYHRQYAKKRGSK